MTSGESLLDPAMTSSKSRGVRLKRNIDLVQHLAAALHHEIGHQTVGFVRIDVVRSHQQKAIAVGRKQESRKLQRILVRRSTRVDAVPRIFETLIERRIEQQAPVAFDDRQDRLAGARHIAAEQQPDPVHLEQTFGQAAKLLRIGRRIVNDGLDHAIEHASAGIDFLDRKERRVQLRLLDAGSNSGLGEQHAHTPWGAGIFAKIHEPDVHQFVVRFERPYVRLRETQIALTEAVDLASPAQVSGDASASVRQARGGCARRPW